MANGATSLAIMEELGNHQFEYYGVDTCEHTDPLPELLEHPRFHFIKGISFSQEVADQVPDKLHWIFIDGCHCEYCVYRDAKVYLPRLEFCGMACFHDACPDFQGVDQSYKTQEHDPSDGVQVLRAVDKLDLEDLHLIEWSRPASDQKQGGVLSFRKMGCFKIV